MRGPRRSAGLGRLARLRWLVAAGALAALGSGRAARADVIYELAPMAGAGATANVYGVPDPNVPQQRFSSTFTTGGGSMRLRYRAAKSDHNLGLRLLYTEYLAAGAPNMLTGNLAWGSAFNLTALWTLRLGAGVTLTRASGNDFGDPATIIPQAQVGGTTYYLATNASQDLAYQPSVQRGYGETFSVSQVRYLSAAQTGIVLPTVDVFAIAARGNRAFGRENYTADASLGDAYTEKKAGLVASADTAPGNNFYGRALAGWQHEYNPYWTTLLQAGPAILFRFDTGAVVAPAGAATLNYRRVPWYASVGVSQAPAPNLYTGGAVMTDQAIARVALPLTKRELLFLGGYGGYAYARISNGVNSLEHNYDQLTGGISLYSKFPHLPLTAALTYVALTQRGNSSTAMTVPDLARQSVFFTLSSELAWGPGTPPLFGGPL